VREEDIHENLKKAVLEYDKERAAVSAKEAIAEQLDPIKMMDVILDAIKQVGDEFSRGELWLPELVGAAEAVKSAIPVIEEEIKKRERKRETVGVVVIGTVKGDIHDIGKNLVATFLTVNGFGVIDLGVDISAEKFIEAVIKHKPNVLAMSALLTVTGHEQRNVIDALKETGIRDKVKVMVGGGAITQGFADDIGADGYDPTAAGAAQLAKSLLAK